MILLFSLLAGSLLAGTWLAFYAILQRAITAQFDRRLIAAAQPVVADLTPDPAEDDMSQLNGPGEDDVTKLDIRDEFFELLDESGRVVQLSKNLRGRALAVGTLPLDATTPVIRESEEPFRGTLRWVVIPMQRGNARRLLLLAMPPVEIVQTLADVRGLISWLLPAALVLTAAISVWYVSRSLRPVADLTRHAAAMAGRAGDVSGSRLWTPLPVSHTDDELGRLADTFNHLFERIDAAVSQLRQFVTDASHELRTPLTVLRGETSLTLSVPREADEYRKSLEFIEEELDKLCRIVQNLFTLSMADAGQLAIARQPLCLNEVLEEACALAAPLGKARRIGIARRLDHEIPSTGDEALLRQLFLIFLDNAVKYSPPDTIVRVDLAACDGHFRIRFADAGYGIAPQHLPHVFERFYRAAPETAQGHGGGLGLAIAQALVRAHDGSIECASTLGRGSTFTVYLPGGNSAT
jgi:signal transduction histidine kinase